MPVCTASTRANIHMQLWNIQVSLDWGGSLARHLAFESRLHAFCCITI